MATKSIIIFVTSIKPLYNYKGSYIVDLSTLSTDIRYHNQVAVAMLKVFSLMIKDVFVCI